MRTWVWNSKAMSQTLETKYIRLVINTGCQQIWMSDSACSFRSIHFIANCLSYISVCEMWNWWFISPCVPCILLFHSVVDVLCVIEFWYFHSFNIHLFIKYIYSTNNFSGGCAGRVRMVIRFRTTYTNNAYHS